MRLYVIRHGESETNRKKQWTGWMDVSLTDKGVSDAKKAGKLLGGVVFDKVYASDLKRAMQTAQTALPHCRPEPTALLREINVGSIAGKPLDVITAEQKAQTSTVGYATYDGETRAEFQQRIDAFLRTVEAQDCETVAAFSHGGWLRAALNTVVGTHLPIDKVCCNNCTVAIFEYANGNWKLHSWINL